MIAVLSVIFFISFLVNVHMYFENKRVNENMLAERLDAEFWMDRSEYWQSVANTEDTIQ